jgi:UDP-N-acetylglucosamine acyltransferase
LGSTVKRDIPPYVLTDGNPAKPYGINSEGLRRRGFSDESIVKIKQAYKIIYKKKMKLSDAVATISEMAAECPELGIMVAFFSGRDRSIVR